MKRLFSLLMAMLMVMTMLPVMSFAVEETALTEAEQKAILDQRRDIAEAHMRKITSMIWRCETDTLFTVTNNALPESTSEYFHLVAGRLYQGLPYSFSGGSYGSWMDLVDGVDEKGVYTVSDLNWQMISGTGTAARFGTDCSGAVTQAWSQIGSSAKPQSTKNMSQKNGYLHVGEYTADETTINDADIAANDPQVMFKAYAQLQKADALVHDGHVRMAVSVNVVYNEDGTINGEESTVTYLEQTREFIRLDQHHYDETLGEEVWEICGVDLTKSFQFLYNYRYRPITCLELIDATAGTTPPAVKDSLSPQNYGYDTLLSGTLTTTNWLMDTVKMTITDQAGATVQQGTIIAPRSGTGVSRFKVPMSMFATDIPPHTLGYIAPDMLKAGAYHCKVVCRLTTGQEFTVRDFDFTVTTAKNDIHKIKMDFTQSTVYDCPMCGEKNAQWQPLTTDYIGSGNGPKTGHYYLPESMENNSSYISTSGQTVCLHLNGKNISSQAQALSVSTSNSVPGMLNVMGDGIVTGTKPSTQYFGAAIQVSGGTVNLYGGTYRHNKNTDTSDTTQRPILGVRNNSTINLYDGAKVEGDPDIKRSSVLIYEGNFNMYGGEVVNGYGTNGGNFLVGYDSGYNLNYLRIFGGTIKNGTASGMGGNIYGVYDSFVYIYGGEVTGGQAAKGGNLAINGGANMRVCGGTVIDGEASDNGDAFYGTNKTTKVASKTLKDESTGEPLVQDLYLKDCGVVISPKATFEGETYTENNAYVRMITAQTEPQLKENLEHLILVDDLTLDLNGYHVSKVTTNGYKLTVFDSATDDYDVADDKYGTIPADAEVTSAPGYLAVTENGKTSFHKYEMQLQNLVISPSKVGISYTTTFQGDEVVKAQVQEFGIAMRAYAAPNATTIWTDAACDTHIKLQQNQWRTGNDAQSVKGVYIKNILDAKLSADENQQRANVPIYGRSYIQLSDGTMLLSDAVSFTMQETMEWADVNWKSLGDEAKANLVNLYQAYEQVMCSWSLPNIQAASGLLIPVNEI